MTERLTIKNSDGSYSQPTHTTFEKMFYRLADLEDIMEKYGIESVEELDSIVNNGLAIIKIQKINILEKRELQHDRDTWKKACELACEHSNIFYCPDNNCEFKDDPSRCLNCQIDKFYQQAQKEIKTDDNETKT